MLRFRPEIELVLGACGMKQPELQMDATLGSAGQARLDFEDSLSTLVCVCWADHFSHCASPQSNGAPQFFLQRPCWLPEGLEGFREPYLVTSTRALLLAWAVRF